MYYIKSHTCLYQLTGNVFLYVYTVIFSSDVLVGRFLRVLLFVRYLMEFMTSSSLSPSSMTDSYLCEWEKGKRSAWGVNLV